MVVQYVGISESRWHFKTAAVPGPQRTMKSCWDVNKHGRGEVGVSTVQHRTTSKNCMLPQVSDTTSFANTYLRLHTRCCPPPPFKPLANRLPYLADVTAAAPAALPCYAAVRAMLGWYLVPPYELPLQLHEQLVHIMRLPSLQGA